MKKSKLLIVSFFALFTLFLAACGDNEASSEGEEQEEQTTFTVGTSPGPYSELFLEAVKPILEEKGYTIETVDFSELLQADIALTEGLVDLKVDQHTADMENYYEEKGAAHKALISHQAVP